MKLKKTSGILLFIFMLLGIVGTFNLTANAAAEDDYYYEELEDGTLEISSYDISETKTDENIVVPSQIKGKKVTSIGDYTFYSNKNIKSVTIPEGITNIGGDAFSSCSNLVDINIAKSVKTIGECAFQYCTSLEKIIIPNGVNEIKAFTFDGCTSLEEITLSLNLKSIEMWSFNECESLKEITIPKQVKSIGSGAFSQCRSLINIIVPEGVSEIKNGTFSLCSKLKSITLPSSITSIEWGNFYNCGDSIIINYNGTKEQWEKIEIEDKDEILEKATINYNGNASSCSHIYDSGKITINPTCTQKGKKTYTCTLCKATKTEEISAKGHTFSTNLPKCSVCGATNSKFKLQGTSIKSFSSDNKSIKATWSKVNSASGYEVQVATDSKFTKNKKTITIAKNSAVSTTNASLKPAQRYYIHVRTYKNQTVKGKTFKGYSAWSGAKGIDTKPNSTSLKSVSGSKKTLKATWSKVAGVTGYEVQVATNSKFTSDKKTVVVTKQSTTSTTVKSLKAKKKYYVHVRTYKTVKVNGKNTKVYSSWSKVKSVTTK